MIARSPALTAVRDAIRDTGRGFLRNTQRTSSTCSVCTGVVGHGWRICAPCNQRLAARGRADRLGFVTYAIAGAQSGHMMRAYKRQPPSPPSEQLVESLLGYAIVAHWDCAAGPEHGRPLGWTYVPSMSSGRASDHPIGRLARQVLKTVPYVALNAAGGPAIERHSIIPDDFTVGGPIPRHVMLIDDTWTTGRHVQAASAALKAAGVDRVTGLCVARWLNPEFGTTQELINRMSDDFDPDVCPYTGDYC